jgi:hypothetical protein
VGPDSDVPGPCRPIPSLSSYCIRISPSFLPRWILMDLVWDQSNSSGNRGRIAEPKVITVEISHFCPASLPYPEKLMMLDKGTGRSDSIGPNPKVQRSCQILLSMSCPMSSFRWGPGQPCYTVEGSHLRSVSSITRRWGRRSEIFWAWGRGMGDGDWAS